MLRSWLDFQRSTFASKLDGLSSRQLCEKAVHDVACRKPEVGIRARRRKGPNPGGRSLAQRRHIEQS